MVIGIENAHSVYIKNQRKKCVGKHRGREQRSYQKKEETDYMQENWQVNFKGGLTV